jgi:hypothetical protein
VAVAEHGLGRQQGELDMGGLCPQRERRFERADAPAGDEDVQAGATVGGRDRHGQRSIRTRGEGIRRV